MPREINVRVTPKVVGIGNPLVVAKNHCIPGGAIRDLVGKLYFTQVAGEEETGNT